MPLLGDGREGPFMKTSAMVTRAVSVFAPELEPRKVASDLPPVPERAPSTGVGYLVMGGILTWLGALSLATSPTCNPALINDPYKQDIRLDTSLFVGGTLIIVGVPLLI